MLFADFPFEGAALAPGRGGSALEEEAGAVPRGGSAALAAGGGATALLLPHPILGGLDQAKEDVITPSTMREWGVGRKRRPENGGSDGNISAHDAFILFINSPLIVISHLTALLFEFESHFIPTASRK